MNNYKTGLVSISFRNLLPGEILVAMKEAGLSCIEWGSDVHAPCDDTDNLKKIATMQKEYGIFASSYGTYFRLGVNDTNELEKYIAAAKILGTDLLRLWCGNKGSAEYNEEEKQALFFECIKAAEIAKEHSVKFCLECHNWTYTDTKESAYELMQTVASPHFHMYWQPNQFKSEEENIEYAKLLSPYTEHIHVFNWRENDRLPLAAATDVWKRYLENFCRDKTLLLEFMPDGRIESLTEETMALKRIIEE